MPDSYWYNVNVIFWICCWLPYSKKVRKYAIHDSWILIVSMEFESVQVWSVVW